MEWYIPVLIFLARICDVSIGTVRTMAVVAGHTLLASLLGFFEVVIWVLAAGGALHYLSEPIAIISYAGGFATGVYVGMWIERWLALGWRMVRVIVRPGGATLAAALRERGYRVTTVDGAGREGPVEIDFLVIRRRQLPGLRRLVAQLAPRAFLTVERVDPPSNGGGAGYGRFGRRFLEGIVVRK